MVELLGQWDNQIETEIWASYEALFFSSTLSDILKVYVLAYDAEAKLLQMLLPTADPRNMNLSGERVIDILQSGIQEVDPISFVEEHYGTSTGGTSSISTQGSNQAEGAAADTHKDHDQSEVICGEDLEQNSASYRSMSSNLFQEMENLYPFLHDVDLEATGQGYIPDDQPVKESQSGKQCIPSSPKLQKLEYEGGVKLRHSRDDPRKRKRRSVQVIVTGQSSLVISTPQFTEKAAGEDSIRPLSVPASIHMFNRESTTLEDLGWVRSQKVKEDASSEDVGEHSKKACSIAHVSVIEKRTQTDPTSSDEDDSGVSSKDLASISRHGFNRQDFYREIKSGKDLSKWGISADSVAQHQIKCVDTVSHISVTSNLVEEMEDLYPFLRDVTHLSAHLDNLSAIMTNSQNVRSEGQGTLPRPGQERYSTNSLLEGPFSFEEMFSQPYCCLRMVLEERFPLAKLRWLVRCLQALTESVKEQVSRKCLKLFTKIITILYYDYFPLSPT
ncbi:uncharacterized protein LOC121418324 isoform X2 [Lytechinus variegatus]|nr:uncharacterized protein LOC121418324 isoform X2 [Lytechinus variegatus]